jgi:hypothetical protein
MEETILKLIRQRDTGTQTEGMMFVMAGTGLDSRDLYKCYTLELPWKNNEHQISCIPKGTYECQKVGISPRIHYAHIWVKNVPDRDGIKIHAANFVSQLRGCIAPGEYMADLNKDGMMDVVASKRTLSRLMEYLPEEFKLIII